MNPSQSAIVQEGCSLSRSGLVFPLVTSILWVGEGERPGQRSVPIGLRELHLPTYPVEERHERSDGYRLMGAGIGENKANMFAGLRGLDGSSVAGQKALAGN